MKKYNKNSKPIKPYNVQVDDLIMRCPYDVVHFVRAKKIVGHLIKCRRNWISQHDRIGEAALILTCRYNCYHRVPAPEIMFHEKRCRDRSLMTAYMIEFTTHDGNPGLLKKRHHLYSTMGKPFTETQVEITPAPGSEGKVVMRLNSELEPNIVAISTIPLASDQLQPFPFSSKLAKDDGDNEGMIEEDEDVFLAEEGEEEWRVQDEDISLQGISHNLLGFERVMAPAVDENEAEEIKGPQIQYDEDWEEEGSKCLPFDSMKGFHANRELSLKYPANLSKKDRKDWRNKNVNKAKDIFGGILGNVDPIFQPLIFPLYPPVVAVEVEEQDQHQHVDEDEQAIEAVEQQLPVSMEVEEQEEEPIRIPPRLTPIEEETEEED